MFEYDIAFKRNGITDSICVVASCMEKMWELFDEKIDRLYKNDDIEVYDVICSDYEGYFD